MSASNFSFLATCVPGAEPWLARELAHFELTVSPIEGGVEGRATLAALRRALARTRLAEAIRVRPVQAFQATSFEELQRGLNKVPWHAYLVPSHPFEVRVTCKQSRLYHSDAVAERAQGAIRRGPNQRMVLADAVNINAHHNRIYLRLNRDKVQVSIDTAGEALHRRGYRPHVHEAPLRETLAALLLTIAEQGANHPVVRVWDPFCGSGTIPLEWLDSHTTPSGERSTRRYIMDEWPCTQKLERLELVAEPPNAERRVWLSDIAERAVEAARANASILGVEARCSFLNIDFEAAAQEVPDGTAVVTNVPYGVRLGTPNDVARLIARLDKVLQSRPGLRPAVVLLAGIGLPRSLPGNWEPVVRFKNGGVQTSVIRLR
jgi:putative N6-adenine-specific DNA methylase